jgi:hypothetical protein
MGIELAKELETYNAHKADLLKDAGKFVLVHGDQLAGVYDTYAEALREGYKQFQLKPFMVSKFNTPFSPFNEESMSVNKSLFNDLMQSLKEAKAISQGKLRPSRRFIVLPADVKAAHNMVALRSARGRARF